MKPTLFLLLFSIFLVGCTPTATPEPEPVDSMSVEEEFSPEDEAAVEDAMMEEDTEDLFGDEVEDPAL